MLQIVFFVLLGMGLFYGLMTGRGDRVFSALMEGAKDGIGLVMEMMGVMAIFCGLMKLLSLSGVTEKLNRIMRKPLRFLMGKVPEEALSYVTMNLSANMLGLGNAATPMGIEAARRLADGDRASNALCMFLVINASSVQLMPSTVVALRMAHGAANPEAVIWPGMIATGISTLFGILCCKWMEKKAWF